MHIGILRWILGMTTEVTLAWGFWTIFGGLVFSLVHEKSGGILGMQCPLRIPLPPPKKKLPAISC